ncbi:MAG: DNA/RNA nuclease SfsA [Pseudomonadota bacterium]
MEDGLARFPDAVTTRGTKHLEELSRLVREGRRGVIFFLVLRMDAKAFTPAADIDPDYARALETAVRSGVEILVRDAVLDFVRIRMGKSLPWYL